MLGTSIVDGTCVTLGMGRVNPLLLLQFLRFCAGLSSTFGSNESNVRQKNGAQGFFKLVQTDFFNHSHEFLRDMSYCLFS